MVVIYSPILPLILTEISPYETPHNGASGMGMHCLPMSHKVFTQANCWWSSLLGADFVRGRVCQGPSLSGAEMSRNR